MGVIMKVEELASKINDLEIRLEGLKENISVFQDNINNNIYWFYSVLGILVAFIGAVGVALYFLVKISVSKGIESGINQIDSSVRSQIELIKSDIEKLKPEIDDRIVELIEGNRQIKWAKGSIGGNSLDQQKLVEIHGLAGPIAWDNPLTFIELRGIRSKRKLEFNILQKLPNGFVAEVLNKNDTDGGSVEFTIIWESERIKKQSVSESPS